MSDALKLLQEKCGATPDGSFGPNTARAIVQHYELKPERGAHLLGQVVHESGSFRYVRENLSYSVEALMKVWPSRFASPEEAKPYARNPKKLAEKVYSGRMGNVEGSGDASKFIGRGFLQLTGKNNYSAFASDMRIPEVLNDPSLVEKEYAFDTAIWFFDKNGLFKLADEGINDEVIKKITKRVNGGYTGLDHRNKETKKIYQWLS